LLRTGGGREDRTDDQRQAYGRRGGGEEASPLQHFTTLSLSAWLMKRFRFEQ
jgi:hypothetical protein